MSSERKKILYNFSLLDENSTLNLCRICLEDGAELPIFEANQEENYDILTKLSLCLKEKVEDIEGYPRFICNICSNSLDSACSFINRYKESCKILESGIDMVKQENKFKNNGHIETEIEIERIKNEICDNVSDNDGFSDDDKEFLEPLLKVKIKLEKSSKTVKKSKPNTNTKQVTNKIASAILEGQFAWNGDKWCLKRSKTVNAKPVNKAKLLNNIKTEQEKKKRVKIEIPKIKKPDPPKLCDICGVVFRDSEKLSIHKRKVHFKQAIKCPHCMKMLSSSYYLNRHIKRKHAESKDFMCAQCGRGFAFKGELRNHNRTVHEKHLLPKKQFKCKFCSKTYKCAKSIVVHERSAHTGQRPAVCSVCDSSFFHEDYLKEHMRLHTGETPFKCPVCGRGYAQRCNMKSHLKIHRISEVDSVILSKLKPNYLRLLKT